MEFKSQIATTVEQSKRLMELGLKKETADMHITNMSHKGLNYTDDWKIGSISYCDVMSFWDSKGLQLEKSAWSVIPAWSLHRLIMMSAVHNGRILMDIDIPLEMSFYDEVVKTIEILIKRGLFNQEYLEGTICQQG